MLPESCWLQAVKPIKAVPSLHVVGYLDDDKAGSLALAKELHEAAEALPFGWGGAGGCQ